MPADGAAEVERIFRAEATRRMARVDSIVAEGLPPAPSPERIELWRHIHTLQGTATSLGHEHIARISAALATRLGIESTPGTREVPEDEIGAVRDEIAMLRREVAALVRQP
jgi:chemotaxis protein histidine kinase CheA